MSDRVLEADDTTVEADDWAALEPKPAPLDVSAELQRQVDEYLARGGQIKTFEPGETAIPTNYSLWSFPVGKAATPDPKLRDDAAKNQLRKVMARHADDAVLVATMNIALSSCSTMVELRKVCGGCSPAKIWRMIRDHYPDDKRAERFRKRSREEREADLLIEVKKVMAEGYRGIRCVADRVGRQFGTVSALDKKHKLGIALPMGSGHRVSAGRSRDGSI